MNWLFVAVLGGNLMTATFDKESGCLGQKDITQRDQHVSGQCVELHPSSNTGWITNGTTTVPLTLTPNGGWIGQ